jgi:hypothetical protein
VPVDVAEDALSDRGEGQQGSAPSAPRLLVDDASPDGDENPTVTRVTLRPHDPATGEEIDKGEVVKGYEYARGEFVTFTTEGIARQAAAGLHRLGAPHEDRDAVPALLPMPDRAGPGRALADRPVDPVCEELPDAL